MIRAIHFRDRDAFMNERVPGSFHLSPAPGSYCHAMWFHCPCGCGLRQRILIGEGQKPEGPGPSWRWNGSRTEPSLFPSVNIEGHWHGHLRDGYWEVC